MLNHPSWFFVLRVFPNVADFGTRRMLKNANIVGRPTEWSLPSYQQGSGRPDVLFRSYRTHEEIRKSEMMNPFLRALDRSRVQPPTRKQFPRLEYVDLRLENLASSTNMCNQAFSLQTCAHHTFYTVLYYIEYLYVVVQSWFIQYYQRISYAILMYIITIQYKPCISLSTYVYHVPVCMMYQTLSVWLFLLYVLSP